jgi:hypothetical protein
MLLYYLRDFGLAAVAARTNVDSANTAAAVSTCPRQTDFCACVPCSSASDLAEPRSTGKCRKGRFRVRCRSAIIVAAGVSPQSTAGWPTPQPTGNLTMRQSDGLRLEISRHAAPIDPSVQQRPPSEESAFRVPCLTGASKPGSRNRMRRSSTKTGRQNTDARRCQNPGKSPGHADRD